MEGKNMRRVVRICLAAAASATLILGAADSASAGTLDQQEPTIGGIGLFAHSSQSLAQTFTAGISGGLDQADLGLANFNSPSPDLIVEIRDGSAAGAGSQVLASGHVPASSVGNPAFVPVSFSPHAPVVAGHQYAIVAYTSAAFPNNYAWQEAGGDPYPAGAAFTNGASPPAGSWTDQSPGDFAFKTYVVPSPSGPTGQRAAALASCKKRAKQHHWSHQRLRKCKKKANLLPV
jgi:hypothetical protein